jgi:hypothetical protein
MIREVTRESVGGNRGCVLQTRGIVVGVGGFSRRAKGFVSITNMLDCPLVNLEQFSNQLKPQAPPPYTPFVPQSIALGFWQNCVHDFNQFIALNGHFK